jgi:WD40 repeat protein
MDGTACLWRLGKTDPILQFKQVFGNIITNLTSIHATGKTTIMKKATQQPVSSTQIPPIYRGEIKNAQFYYRDKFIALANMNSLYLYKYYLTKVEDQEILKKQTNKYKVIQLYKSKTFQAISCFSCINSFHSNIMFLGGSNKCIDIYDVSANNIVRHIPDAHTRQVHTITLNALSGTNITEENMQLFLTASTDSCIKLWDLRVKSCVRMFSQHRNTTQTIGNSFSVDGRYIMTGSEDRCVYVYDIRSGTCAHKLQAMHSDVVSDIKFRSASQMASCSYDGRINFYSNKQE